LLPFIKHSKLQEAVLGAEPDVAQSLRNRFIEVDDLVGFPANDFSSPKRDYFSNMTNRSKRGPHNRLGFAIQPDYQGMKLRCA
jgi:hypothetical protein